MERRRVVHGTDCLAARAGVAAVGLRLERVGSPSAAAAVPASLQNQSGSHGSRSDAGASVAEAWDR